MRKPEEIRKEIDQLNKELEAVKIYEAKRDAAVHILTNLGWTHSGLKGWQKPEPKRSWKEFDSDTMGAARVGDFVKSPLDGKFYVVVDNTDQGGRYLVRQLVGRIGNNFTAGMAKRLHKDWCKVVSKAQITL